jgi:hypothetical protein
MGFYKLDILAEDRDRCKTLVNEENNFQILRILRGLFVVLKLEKSQVRLRLFEVN